MLLQAAFRQGSSEMNDEDVSIDGINERGNVGLCSGRAPPAIHPVTDVELMVFVLQPVLPF